MNSHIFATIVWLAIVAAGYLVIDYFAAPEPVVRVLSDDGHEIVVPVARDGHFYIEGTVNGQPVTFLVDTGASYVSVGSDVARRAKMPAGVAGFFNTANGNVEGRIVRGQTVKADIFEMSDVTVAVMPAKSQHGLLGQNFLRHFTISQAGGKLILKMLDD